MGHSGFHFLANLKPYTVRRGTGNRQFRGYLLSIDFAHQFADLAREVLRDGDVLCADNGNVDVVRALIASNTAEASALDRERRDHIADAERRRALHAELPAALRDRYRSLAKHVSAASALVRERASIERMVRAQSALGPTYQIGGEDCTISALTALGVRPEIVALGTTFYSQIARSAVKLAQDTEAGRYGASRAPVFACVHAADYDTARIAGRVAGKARVSGIAASLVSSLQSKDFIRSRIEAGKVINLTDSMPRPYVAVAQIVAGLHEGYVEASGHRPNFHALGMGTPILLPLLAALGDGVTFTAADSTAPIIDGWSGPTISLYVDEPAPLKYKAYKIAEVWLDGGRGWDCPCPYCRALERAFPPRIDEARKWRRDHPGKLSADSLRAESPLSGWLPLLGNAADPGLRLGGAMARVGHNHWILQRIETAARHHSGSHDALVKWVDGVVASYIAAPSDPAWKLSITVAWQLLRASAERTRHARPSSLAS
ncbi:MAG TPA: hypothetical protein VIV40_24380 [Kofleriaceae bacterium]